MLVHLLRPLLPLALLACTVAACAEDVPLPQAPAPGDDQAARIVQMDRELRQVLQAEGIEPLVAPPRASEPKIKLGQMLFFDPELSGHRDTSCVTCHRPTHAMVDGLAVPAGTTARIDPTTGARLPGRDLDFVSRNVPDLFNRGQPELDVMFWDKRLGRAMVEGTPRFVIFESMGQKAPDRYFRVLAPELENTLAAQNMMPVLNREELRGAPLSSGNTGSQNELSNLADSNPEGIWSAVMRRLMAIEGYRTLFRQAYPEVRDLEAFAFPHAANAISAFLIGSLTFFDSPWDRYVAGDSEALGEQELRGALLFYGKGACSTCHSGALFTDQQAHNLGVTPLTRGPDRRPGQFIDRGIAHTSRESSQMNFHFKTPALRNVALTAPYMHNGTIDTLEHVIWHKHEMRAGLWGYDTSQLRPEFHAELHTSAQSFEAIERTLTPLLSQPLGLGPAEVADLVAFLNALTSPSAKDLTHLIPDQVPSGLPIDIPAVPGKTEAITGY